MGPTQPGSGGDGADRRHRKRGPRRRLGASVAGVIDAVHRARRGSVVEQHGAGDGAEYLGGDVRSGCGDAVGAGGEAKSGLADLPKRNAR